MAKKKMRIAGFELLLIYSHKPGALALALSYCVSDLGLKNIKLSNNRCSTIKLLLLLVMWATIQSYDLFTYLLLIIRAVYDAKNIKKKEGLC